MKYQVLVSTMHQKDTGIYQQMHLDCDAIIVNQCDHCGCTRETINGHSVRMYSFDERGVGLSRNSALMRADADIIEFADDDMIFTEGSREAVIREFEQHPEADAILFSIESLNPDRPLLKIREFSRVTKLDALKYGCARLAVRRKKILYSNITFSLLFGGGAKYGSGEDTIFLQDCIRAGLKIYKSPVKVADVNQGDSSWFSGYHDRYFLDKGALSAAALPVLCYPYAALTALRSSYPGYTRQKILHLYLQGIREFKNIQRSNRHGA